MKRKDEYSEKEKLPFVFLSNVSLERIQKSWEAIQKAIEEIENKKLSLSKRKAG